MGYHAKTGSDLLLKNSLFVPLNDSAYTPCVLSDTQIDRQYSKVNWRKMSEKSMWIAFWSIIGAAVLMVAAPLIILIPVVLTILFIGGGL